MEKQYFGPEHRLAQLEVKASKRGRAALTYSERKLLDVLRKSYGPAQFTTEK